MPHLDPRAYGRLAQALEDILATLHPDLRRRTEALLRRPGVRAVLTVRLGEDGASGIADFALEDDDGERLEVATIDATHVGYHVVAGELVYAHQDDAPPETRPDET